MKWSSENAFTLLEVVITLSIFTFVALFSTRGLMQTRYMSEANIRESTATATVSGYIEQIKSMEFNAILESIGDNSTPLPTRLSQGEPDPIYLNKWNKKIIVIDMDSQSSSALTMNLYIYPDIQEKSESEIDQALNIKIDYAWENIETDDRIERTLRTQRSYVPTF